jgi:anthranilate phosphoribosyltransferase
VAAGGGLTVAKHGNRSVSSRCGSADVLEALGINIALVPEKVEESLQELKLAFLFAPAFHPAMKHALGPRREIGIRTAFNLLGPLTNPAGACVHLLGLYREDMTRPVAEVLKKLGSKAAYVVHGEDHGDEISISGKTTVCYLKDGDIRSYQIEPEMAGIQRASLEAIRGGTPEKNAHILREILRGEPGPPRDVVLLNAAAVFMAAGRVANLPDGIQLARESIDSGKAMKKLQDLIQFSQRAGWGKMFLEKVIARKREEINGRKTSSSLKEMKEMVSDLPSPRDLMASISKNGPMALIAEI